MNGKFLKTTGLSSPQQVTRNALQSVLLNAKNKKPMLGWVDLPWQSDAYKECQKWVKKVKKSQKTLCILGIGGSSLGAKAVYDFLAPKKEIIFLSNVDGYQFEKNMSKINLKNTHFLVISKSGETSETLIQFAHLEQAFKKTKLKIKDHVSVITEKKQGKLKSIADQLGLYCLDVPVDVGGRFSVFSQVGLAPLLWANIDVKKIFLGAKSVLDHKDLISSVCDFYLQSFNAKKTISVFWFYCDALQTFGLWLEQLWSESLAKANGPVVSTPLVCVGSNDQHSLLQQFNEGLSDKSYLFFRNLESEKSTKIKKTKLNELRIFENHSVGELLGLLAQATQQVLKNKSNPVFEMIVQDHGPQTIGALIYFFELVVATLGECLSVNAYNQPGVEEGKKITLGTLGDTRYSDFALK